MDRVEQGLGVYGFAEKAGHTGVLGRRAHALGVLCREKDHWPFLLRRVEQVFKIHAVQSRHRDIGHNTAGSGTAWAGQEVLNGVKRLPGKATRGHHASQGATHTVVIVNEVNGWARLRHGERHHAINRPPMRY